MRGCAALLLPRSTRRSTSPQPRFQHRISRARWESLRPEVRLPPKARQSRALQRLRQRPLFRLIESRSPSWPLGDGGLGFHVRSRKVRSSFAEARAFEEKLIPGGSPASPEPGHRTAASRGLLAFRGPEVLVCRIESVCIWSLLVCSGDRAAAQYRRGRLLGARKPSGAGCSPWPS